MELTDLQHVMSSTLQAIIQGADARLLTRTAHALMDKEQFRSGDRRKVSRMPQTFECTGKRPSCPRLQVRAGNRTDDSCFRQNL